MPSATLKNVELLPAVAGLSAARRRLYITALRQFAKRGYHAVGIRDITDELGMHPGAFYAHASSKQELLGQLILIGVREHRDRLRAAVQGAGSDPEDQLRELVRTHVFVHLDYADLARLFSREERSLTPVQFEETEAITHETEQELVAVIQRGRAVGIFGDVDTFLVGVVLGDIGIRLPEWWTPDAPRTREQIADTYAAFALKLMR